MTEITPLDRQLADIAWMMATALQSGYSRQEVFEQLAAEAPEPAAGGCRGVVAEVKAGVALPQALRNWQQADSSLYLRQVTAAFSLYPRREDNLPWHLERISEDIFQKAGSDGSCWPAMRRLAENVGAEKMLPQRVA